MEEKEVGENQEPRAESGQLEGGTEDGVEWLQCWTGALPWQEGCTLISLGRAISELLKADHPGTETVVRGTCILNFVP